MSQAQFDKADGSETTQLAPLDERELSSARPSILSPWKKTVEVLEFQFGPWVLGRWRFAALTNTTSAVNKNETEIPQVDIPVSYRHASCVADRCKIISLDYDVIRYVSRRDVRYYIKTSNMTFDEYLMRFSKKMRGNLKRQIKYFSYDSGGSIDLRHCQSDEEMADFCKHADTISRLKHQSKVGWNLSDFDDRICGFLLMNNGEPAAYALCTIENDILIYQYTEYNPKYTKLSPGTVLFLLIIRKILLGNNINFVDIGASTTWKYKKSFATDSVEYTTVHWFPKSLKHLTIIIMHRFTANLWRAAAWLKNILRQVVLCVVGYATFSTLCVGPF